MNLISSPAFNAVIVLLIVVSSLSLGVIVYLQNKSEMVNKLFAFFSISTAYWILFAFIPDIEAFRSVALLSAKLNYLALLGFGFSLIMFPFYFPRKRYLPRIIKYMFLAGALCIGVLAIFTNQVIAGLEYFSWGASYLDGPLAPIFYLYMLGGTINAIGQYLFIWPKLNPNEKREVELFATGLIVFLLTNILIQSVVKPFIVGTDEYYRIGNYSAVFMVILTGYAIIKRGLFDVKVFATEAITVIIWVVLVIKLFITSSVTEGIVDGIILFVVVIFGMLLIRSVIREVKHGEQLEDLTSRLRRANNRLKELDQLKDEFVSIASHELRTPMTAIKSYLWMALNQPNQTIKEPLKKYLNISYNSTERLIRLVNDMLTVSRIERNKIELKKEPANIIDVVNLVFEELKITADEKHIAFTFDHPKTALMINGDKEKLREVIQNIVGNALKFTPEKGSITIAARIKGANVTVSVTDTASGIPKESISKLFQKFSKIEYSYSKHSSQPGTGLGLYISKQIAALHGGDIAVESEVGVGSTFTVILPLYTSSKGGEQP